MYVRCLKTYKHIIRYVFFILGIIFLAALIGGQMFFKNSHNAVSSMVSNISTITHNTDLSLGGIGDAIMQTIKGTPVKDQLSDVRENGVKETTENLIEDAINSVIGNYTTYFGEVGEEIGKAVIIILRSLLIWIVLQIVAVILGENITAILAGKEVLNKSTNKMTGNIVNVIFRWIYKLVTIILIVAMIFNVPVIGIILVLAYPLINCFLALLSRYFSSVKGKRAFKEVVNAKNVFTLLFVDLTCIIISLIISVIIMIFIGGLAAFYILISLLAITNVSVRLNAYQIAEGLA